MSVVTEHLEQQGGAFEVLPHRQTEDELGRDFAGYQLEALPPLGTLLDVTVYVDPELLGHATVAFAAGSQTESIKMRTGELFGGGRATTAPLRTRPGRAGDDPIA